MKRTILNKALLLLVLFTAIGCKTRKPPVSVVVAPVQQNKTDINKLQILQQITAREVNYNTLLLKAKAQLAISKNNYDVGMNIRMQKDKIIWVSVSFPLIGEIARAMITPDSLKIMNKHENTYTRKPFSYIYEFTNRQVTFAALQGFFIGKAMKGSLSPSSKIDVNGGQTQLKGKLADLAYFLIYNDRSNLIQNNLEDIQRAQSLIVNYGDYKNVGGQEFPHAATINSKVPDRNISITLNYTQISVNEALDFPFNVPKRFTVKD